MQTASIVRPLLAVVACAAALAAKEPTRKLVIYGERLAGPVEITDPAILALSDVYRGKFLDSTGGVVALPDHVARYEISFYLSARRSLLAALAPSSRLERAYVVDFAYDSVRGDGYVYLPGPGDTWAAWNHGVIIRADREGHWSRASAAWSTQLASVIAHARRRSAPVCPPEGSVRIHPGDSVYADVHELSAQLERQGIHVLCAYHSTLDGMLGVHRTAGIVTPLGPFAMLAFPTADDASRVAIASVVRDGQLLTVLRGPDRAHPVDSLYSADKRDFVVHGRWLLVTFDQPTLREALTGALRDRRAVSGSR